MFHLPVLDRIEKAERILLAGAGGGFDFFCGLPLYFALLARKKQVYLSNYTFSKIEPTRNERIAPFLSRITIDTTGGDYFPEKFFCEWLASKGRESSIYCFDYCGVKPMQHGFHLLKDELNLDAIILVDGGTDSLLIGDEDGLGTPVEDMTTICAANEIDVPLKLLVSLGFGIDAFHHVCHSHVLESIAAQSKSGGYLGALSLLRDMPEVQLFVESSRFVFAKMPHNVSIVASSIIAALDGEFGNFQTTKRTRHEELFINPLMPIYWFFELDKIASRILYLESLKSTETSDDVKRAIKDFRNTVRLKRKARSIPI